MGRAKRKRGIAEALNNREWLAKRDKERAEATRRALRERQLTPGFAPLQVPTLAEELHAMLDAHEPRPTLELDANFRALPRPRPTRPAPRLRIVGENFHGSLGGYTNRKCRCEACTNANRTYMAENRARRRLNVPDDVHGTINGYGNYQCRCEPCRQAARAARLRTTGASA